MNRSIHPSILISIYSQEAYYQTNKLIPLPDLTIDNLGTLTHYDTQILTDPPPAG